MKNNYKHLLYFFGLIIISAIFFISCGNNDTKYESKAVTEHDLSTGVKTYATEEHIVVLSLEHKDADANEYDLNEIGRDCFILRPTKDLNNINLGIDEDVMIGSLSIEDVAAGEISTFTKDDEGATYSFKAGNSYEYCVTHDNSRKEHQALFIRFGSDESQDNRLTFNQKDIDTLSTTKSCIDCDLSHASLEYMPIPDANLSDSILNYASLFGADLTNADLRGAHLESVNLEETTLNYAKIDYDNFTFTSIKNASFVGATISKSFPKPGKYATDLYYAGINFSGANLSNLTIESIVFDSNCTFHYTDFTDATLHGLSFDYGNLAGAIFTGANIYDRDQNIDNIFTKANLSNATWTDGRKCLEGSIGECLDESHSNSGDGWYSFSDPILIATDIGLSDNSAGGGITVGDTDGDGKPNLIAFYIDNPSGENHGYYKVSTNIRSDGTVESWSAPFEVPGWFGYYDSGAGITIADTDRDGKPNLIVYHIANPSGENHAYYRVSSNIDSDGSVASWTDPFEIPDGLGYSSAGGGIAMGDSDKDGIPNLVIVYIDAPDGQNAAYVRTSTGIDSDGSVAYWVEQNKVSTFFGDSTSGAGIATGYVARSSRDREMFVFYIDNPSGENHGYYHRCTIYGDGGVNCGSPHEIPGWFGYYDSGAGMAMDDIDGSGYSNLIIYHIANTSGKNDIYYRIGYWNNLEFPLLESENK